MSATTDRIAGVVAELSCATIDVVPVDRDWSEGYTETWDYVEAPCCWSCGGHARWIDGEELAETLRERFQRIDRLAEVGRRNARGKRRALASDLSIAADDIEAWPAWRCVDQECERFGEEIDPHEGGAEGPMMGYTFPFPGHVTLDDYDAANRIAHLPLCVVVLDPGRDQTYALALTGGGMDLSWQICEAYVELGYLPPVHFADLPAMCGRANLSNGGEYGSPVSERDALVMAACLQSAEVSREQANRRADRIVATIERMSEVS